MPFIPPPPPNLKRPLDSNEDLAKSTRNLTVDTKQHRLSEKGEKFLFSALAVICFAVAIVMFTLMTVL